MAKVWSTKDKIQEGIRLKDEGNAFVKSGEFKKALKSYKTVFLYVNGLICTYILLCFLPRELTPRTHSERQ